MRTTRRDLIRAALPAATLIPVGTSALAKIIQPGQPIGPNMPTAKIPIIDLHSHWISPAVLSLLSARGAGPRVVREADGGYALERTGAGQAGSLVSLSAPWLDIQTRLDHLDKIGVVHQLLSWPTTLGIDPALSPAESTSLWAAFNDDLAQVVRSRPNRFSGVAALSTSDIGWSVRELQRAHGELGLIGAVLPVNGFASLESARHFAPIFEAAQRLKSHIFLHTGFAHQSVPGQPPISLYADAVSLRSALDTAWQFASSVITLAYTDFLDAYPDVTVQVAMLGGSGVSALIAESVNRSGQSLSPRFKRILLDTGAAGQGPAAIAAATRILGPSQIVFGSDYGPTADIGGVVRHVQEAGLGNESEKLVLFQNAASLLARHGVAIGK